MKLLMLCLVLICPFFAAPAVGAGPTKVSISGEASSFGIFDPSFEMAPGSTEGWLAYSAVYGSLNPFGPHVEGRLARSTDGGLTFSQHSIVNASHFTTLEYFDQSMIDGVWNYETSSLAYDPDDAGAEWKHFSHRIFRRTEDNFVEEQNIPAYSWIAYRTAPDPSGPWSAEVALLSSGIFPPAPYDNVRVAISALDASLSDIIVVSEPGAFYHGGVLYVSLTGITSAGLDRIILVASDDHGATWRYVGTPLSLTDAGLLGYLNFDGSAIATQAGRLFLLVTPDAALFKHDGTLVIEFDDITMGTVKRNAGVPVVAKHFQPVPGLPAERRGGQADFHEEAASGLMIPSLQMDDYPEFFQIYATNESIVAPPTVPSMGAGAAVLSIISLIASARLTNRRRGTRQRELAKPRSGRRSTHP